MKDYVKVFLNNFVMGIGIGLGLTITLSFLLPNTFSVYKDDTRTQASTTKSSKAKSKRVNEFSKDDLKKVFVEGLPVEVTDHGQEGYRLVVKGDITNLSDHAIGGYSRFRATIYEDGNKIQSWIFRQHLAIQPKGKLSFDSHSGSWSNKNFKNLSAKVELVEARKNY